MRRIPTVESGERGQVVWMKVGGGGGGVQSLRFSHWRGEIQSLEGGDSCSHWKGEIQSLEGGVAGGRTCVKKC